MSAWDETFDVVVCGFGGAGACAAIEAADEGARVLVLERFEGGGATRKSGGVIYAGGGTDAQSRAGVSDSVDAMLAYLRAETEGAIPEEALRAFAAESAAQIRWLEGLGLEFPPLLFEAKTTQPPDEYGLYYSGNEKQRASIAKPAARGHVPAGPGMTGKVLFAALERAALSRAIEVRRGAQPLRLVLERDEVVGLEVLSLPDVPSVRRAHAALALFATADASARSRLTDFERRYGRIARIRAKGGVVLATGGFVWSPEMMARHAPAYAGCMPLGTVGDDGSGIELGRSVGGALANMDRCAASRFFAPPEAFTHGLLVDAGGRRICDESLYGATISAQIAAHGGRAFLVVDRRILEQAMEELRAEEKILGRPLASILAGDVNHLIFRKYCALVNAYVNRHRADTLEELERVAGIPAGALVETVRAHREVVSRGLPDPLGKARELLAPLDSAPYYAIRCDLDSRLFPGPCITLGGLRIDHATGTVLRDDGSPIVGLHAAGRAAAGIASRSYVSGLSLADCIHSGRRAGRAAAADARVRGRGGPVIEA